MAVAHDTLLFHTHNANSAGWMKLSYCILGRIFVSLILLLSRAIFVTLAYSHAKQEFRTHCWKNKVSKATQKICSFSIQLSEENRRRQV